MQVVGLGTTVEEVIAAGSSDIEVDAYDAAGRRMLDHGDIPPGSLTLSGRTASWTNAGVSMSATLAPRG